MIGLKFSLESTGLDDAIERLDGLIHGGIDRALGRALGGPGGEANGAKWVQQLKTSARISLQVVAPKGQHHLIEGFVQRITHEYHSPPPTAEFRLAPPLNLLAQAMATQEHLMTRTYPLKGEEDGVQRLRQKPLDASPEQAQMIENARDVVREWVETQKLIDARDEAVDFDPEQITDRVMRVLGLGDRSSWKALLSSPELQAAGQRLAGAIETWLAKLLAGDPEAGAPAPGSFADQFGTEPPPAVGLLEDPTLNLTGAFALSPEDLDDWLTVVVAGWKETLAAWLPSVVRQELAAGATRKQSQLL